MYTILMQVFYIDTDSKLVFDPQEIETKPQGKFLP